MFQLPNVYDTIKTIATLGIIVSCVYDTNISSILI